MPIQIAMLEFDTLRHATNLYEAWSLCRNDEFYFVCFEIHNLHRIVLLAKDESPHSLTTSPKAPEWQLFQSTIRDLESIASTINSEAKSQQINWDFIQTNRAAWRDEWIRFEQRVLNSPQIANSDERSQLCKSIISQVRNVCLGLANPESQELLTRYVTSSR